MIFWGDMVEKRKEKYKVIVEAVGDEKIKESAIQKSLNYILNISLCEEKKDESDNIPEGIDRRTS